MKKILALTLCAVMLLTLCISLGSCASVKNPIDYGKKYMVNDNTFYVFYANHTGYYQQKYAYKGSSDPQYNYTLSGQVEFVWEEATDGAVYLFATDVHYDDDHTESKSIGLTSMPIYFSEDFLTFTTHSQYGASNTRAIKQGSDLEKKLEKDTD